MRTRILLAALAQNFSGYRAGQLTLDQALQNAQKRMEEGMG